MCCVDGDEQGIVGLVLTDVNVQKKGTTQQKNSLCFPAVFSAEFAFFL